VTLAVPSASGVDPQATSEYQVYDSPGLTWTPERQSNWLQQLVALLKAKHSVAGIFLSTCSDLHPHRYPHSGLIDAQGRNKPSLQQLLKDAE
jgi:hypothetical protein